VAILADVAGVRLVTSSDRADVVLVASGDARERRDDSEPSLNDRLDDPRPPAGQPSTLTSRERQVLALLAEGATNKAIARRLGISVHTAKFHVGSLLDKLDAAGRTDAVAHAARLGVIVL
jgi:DNA-binding CsgD family transcriptional regulator